MLGTARGRPWWLALVLVLLGFIVVVLNYNSLLPGGTEQSWLWIGLMLFLVGALLVIAFVVGSLGRTRSVNDGDG
jgi:hypothetical protein